MLHLGKNNPKNNYIINNYIIPAVSQIRDLGIIITDDLDFGPHCKIITRNAIFAGSMIFKAFETRNTRFLVDMFKTYVRPKVEYAIEIWNPTQASLIDLVENVQRKFTKRIPSVSNLSYQERLIQLDLESLELRRLKTDLTMVYKISNNHTDLNKDEFFQNFRP